MRRKGFTLIELLIVVAIIAILALIAVPNFLEAQVRAKVARAKNDLRSVATAMEAYRVDWNGLPLRNSFDLQAGGVTNRRNMNPGALWWALTTPISYITGALVDPFTVVGTHSGSHVGDTQLLDAYLQISTGFLGVLPQGTARELIPKTEWLGMSYGPDGADDTDLNSAYPYTAQAIPYDPTNGTASWGDIYRHGGQVPVNFIVGHTTDGALPHGSNCQGNVQGQGDPYRWSQ